jgi:hypothetical protein
MLVWSGRQDMSFRAQHHWRGSGPALYPSSSLPDLLSYSEVPAIPTPCVVAPTEEPPQDYVIPETGAEGEDDGGDFRHFDPPISY